jgi:hypothetical protein
MLNGYRLASLTRRARSRVAPAFFWLQTVVAPSQD